MEKQFQLRPFCCKTHGNTKNTTNKPRKTGDVHSTKFSKKKQKHDTISARFFAIIMYMRKIGKGCALKWRSRYR